MCIRDSCRGVCQTTGAKSESAQRTPKLIDHELTYSSTREKTEALHSVGRSPATPGLKHNSCRHMQRVPTKRIRKDISGRQFSMSGYYFVSSNTYLYISFVN